MVVPYHLEYYTTTYNDDAEFNNMLYVFKCTSAHAKLADDFLRGEKESA